MKLHQIGQNSLHLKGLHKTQGHKFSHGHLLVVSGGAGRTGAARLAARGALRIGAGLVTLAVPEAAMTEVGSQVTAVMLREADDFKGLTALLRDDRINALCIGPGLGLGPTQSGMVRAALTSGRDVLLDADALTLVAQDRMLLDGLHDRCVITPHRGEFARLFPDISERLSADPPLPKAEAAALAAGRAGCVVLLKGAETVVAQPNGEVGMHAAKHDRAAPWLATAGSGDVLSGFIAGLMARGFAPHDAAELGVFLHASAAISFGPGLIAEDLPEQLPTVLSEVLGQVS
jgi:ADP-dependent NAD(P)H-hydrate dehydratase / NAD(P)H-hydrate epimerase